MNNITYNSQKEKLIISEYGRNVQNLINYAKGIEEDEKRQEAANAIIELMHMMNPVHKNNQEYKEKLWRHLFRIAKFEISVTPSTGEMPSPESSALTPDIVKYPSRDYAYRHYGNNVKSMITKAKEMKDDEKRKEFAEIIGAYMKLAYRTWSRDHNVSDEIIRSDINKLSDGLLSIDDDVSLDALVSKVKAKNNRSHSNYKSNHKNNKRNRNHKRRR